MNVVELCSLCGEPLDADNCYGEKELPLCRYHHEKMNATLNFLLTGQIPLPNVDYGYPAEGDR